MAKRPKDTRSGGAVDLYCDIAGFAEDRAVYYGYDASECTLIEVEGVRSILSPGEYEDALQNGYVAGVAALLRQPGHQMSISYESSSMCDDDLEPLVAAQQRNARAKRLSVESIISEGAALIRGRARRERALVALWTRPEAGLQEDVARDEAKNRAAKEALPPARNAQTPYLGLAALDGPHAGATQKVLDALHTSKLKVRVLGPGPERNGPRDDLAEVRKAVLYHETPNCWSPFGPTDRKYPGAKDVIDRDTSELFSPPVAQQILSSAAMAAPTLRTISIGGRQYAVVAISVFPKAIQHFSRLLATLVDNTRLGAIPFRVCFHFEGLDSGSFGLRKILAGLTAWSNPATNNLFQALRRMQEIHERDMDTVVKARIIATTWIEPGEAVETLEQRRSYLVRALMTWGDTIVMEAPSNPMRALAETACGMTMRAVVPRATLAPLSHAAAMLPFHRPAQIFPDGETLFLTPDGRIMPHKGFSSDQLHWFTLIYATPGSGKSVLFNRLNYEFVAYSAGPRLPFVAIIDVGISSRGLIDVLRHALPEARRTEAQYIRLQNTVEYAINPFDLGLFRRTPLPREVTYLESFLHLLLGFEDGDGEGRKTPLADQLVSHIIKQLYQEASDLELTNAARQWQPGVDPDIDAEAQKMGLNLRERTRWWSIVDAFGQAGKFRLAMRAQRQAVPRLDDIPGVLSSRSTQADFPAELIQYAQRSIEAAIERYPIFASATALDLEEARVMSIDLQDVVQRYKSSAAERSNSLFFLAAHQIFTQKISGHVDDIRAMTVPQAMRRVCDAYWQSRYDDMSDAPKRLGMDEYHLTGSTEQIRKVIFSTMREGRKWGLEIILVSQALKDFAKMGNMASTVMILNADSAEDRNDAQETFGFSDAVKERLQKEVHGPKDGLGSSFLCRYKLREEDRWIVLNNLIGPVLLWALTTRREDRLLRDELYRRLSVNETLQVLARRYPGGTAIDHWRRTEAALTDSDARVPALMADQIMGEIIAQRGATTSSEDETT